MSRRDARRVVDLFFGTLTDTLEANEEVALRGFGRFRLLEKGERPGRNPATGESAPVTARRVVAFRAAIPVWESVGRLDPPADR